MTEPITVPCVENLMFIDTVLYNIKKVSDSEFETLKNKIQSGS